MTDPKRKMSTTNKVAAIVAIVLAVLMTTGLIMLMIKWFEAIGTP